jgi:hypothetical protein
LVAAGLALTLVSGLSGCGKNVSQSLVKTIDAAESRKVDAAAADPAPYIGDTFSDVEHALVRKSEDTDPPAPTF